MSMEFFTDTLLLGGKCRREFPSTFHYCTQLQTVDRILHRHFSDRKKTSMENSVDILRLVAKCRKNSPPHDVDTNFHRRVASYISGKNRWIYLRNKNSSISHQKEHGQEKFSNI